MRTRPSSPSSAVVAGAAGDPVVAQAADDVVVLGVAEQPVVAGAAVDRVLAGLAVELVVAGAVEQRDRADDQRRVVDEVRERAIDSSARCCRCRR